VNKICTTRCDKRTKNAQLQIQFNIRNHGGDFFPFWTWIP